MASSASVQEAASDVEALASTVTLKHLRVVETVLRNAVELHPGEERYRRVPVDRAEAKAGADGAALLARAGFARDGGGALVLPDTRVAAARATAYLRAVERRLRAVDRTAAVPASRREAIERLEQRHATPPADPSRLTRRADLKGAARTAHDAIRDARAEAEEARVRIAVLEGLFRTPPPMERLFAGPASASQPAVQLLRRVLRRVVDDPADRSRRLLLRAKVVPRLAPAPGALAVLLDAGFAERYQHLALPDDAPMGPVEACLAELDARSESAAEHDHSGRAAAVAMLEARAGRRRPRAAAAAAPFAAPAADAAPPPSAPDPVERTLTLQADRRARDLADEDSRARDLAARAAALEAEHGEAHRIEWAVSNFSALPEDAEARVRAHRPARDSLGRSWSAHVRRLPGGVVSFYLCCASRPELLPALVRFRLTAVRRKTGGAVVPAGKRLSDVTSEKVFGEESGTEWGFADFCTLETLEQAGGYSSSGTDAVTFRADFVVVG